jgi:hypothetical protein
MPFHILPIEAVFLLHLYLQIYHTFRSRSSTYLVNSSTTALLFSVGDSFVGKVGVSNDRSHTVNLCSFSLQLAVLLNDIRINV